MNVVIKNEQILDAAAEVLAKRPDATLQSIAKAAGISRTTIFHKFATRDALLEALSVDTLERIGAVMARVPETTERDPVEVLTEVTQLLMTLGPRTVFLRVVPGWGNDLTSTGRMPPLRWACISRRCKQRIACAATTRCGG